MSQASLGHVFSQLLCLKTFKTLQVLKDKKSFTQSPQSSQGNLK